MGVQNIRTRVHDKTARVVRMSPEARRMLDVTKRCKGYRSFSEIIVDTLEKKIVGDLSPHPLDDETAQALANRDIFIMKDGNETYYIGKDSDFVELENDDTIFTCIDNFDPDSSKEFEGLIPAGKDVAVSKRLTLEEYNRVKSLR
jgi:hypothetical protein